MKKRVLSLALAVLMLFSLLPVSVMADGETSGSCTYDNVTYTLKNGVLTVSGKDVCDSIWKGDFDKTSVTEVVLNDGITCINYSAFSDCTALLSITIPDSVTKIGWGAFSGCAALESIVIPDSVSIISNCAFADCTALESITLGSGLTSIGQDAFKNTAYYNNAANWEGDYLYLGDCLLTAAESPIQEPCVVKEGTRFIAGGALQGQNEIPSLTLPESLEIIDSGAFSGCSSITKLYIPANVTVLGSSAFSQCSSITKLVIEGKLSTISDSAFRGCSSLAEAHIPASVKSIEQYAFESCFSLAVVYIPDSVETVGDFAFYNCWKITDVHYSGDEDAWNAITFGFYNDSLTGAYIHCGSDASTTDDSYTENGITYTMKDGTLTVSGNGSCDEAWTRKFDAAAVKRLVIENGMTDVADDAFSDCTELESVTILDSVTSIGQGAFSGCTALKSVSIGSGLASATPTDIFKGCAALESISVSEENEHYASVNNALYSKYNGKLNVLLLVPVTISGDFTVPTGVGVIGSNAFDSCSLITSITMPDSVKNIQPSAFRNCSSLKSLTIPGSVASIGINVLEGCTALTDIYYSGTQRQWEIVETDLGKDRLTNVEVHFVTETHTHLYTDTVQEPTCTKPGCTRHDCYCGDSYVDSNVDALGHDFKDNVCTRCGKRTSWTDDNGISFVLSGSTLTVSGSGALSSGWVAHIARDGIKKLIIEDGITDIGRATFSGLSSLESVTLPGNLLSIGSWAFFNCRSLESVTIPNSLMSIGESAFFECFSLADVYYAGTEVQWKTISVGIDNDSLLNATIHYGDAPAPAGAFTDVPRSAYYAIPVAWAVDKGITGGYPDGTFRPMNTCTRAQIVTFIWRANGSPEPLGTAKGFNDVAEGTYYYKAVLWAAEKGITGGFDDGGFHPDELVTRAQAMTFLWRAEGSFCVAEEVAVNRFKDVSNTAYYYEAVLWAVAFGITGGYDASTFGTMDGCTRAQIVTFLYRTMAQ